MGTETCVNKTKFDAIGWGQKGKVEMWEETGGVIFSLKKRRFKLQKEKFIARQNDS